MSELSNSKYGGVGWDLLEEINDGSYTRAIEHEVDTDKYTAIVYRTDYPDAVEMQDYVVEADAREGIAELLQKAKRHFYEVKWWKYRGLVCKIERHIPSGEYFCHVTGDHIVQCEVTDDKNKAFDMVRTMTTDMLKDQKMLNEISTTFAKEVVKHDVMAEVNELIEGCRCEPNPEPHPASPNASKRLRGSQVVRSMGNDRFVYAEAEPRPKPKRRVHRQQKSWMTEALKAQGMSIE